MSRIDSLYISKNVYSKEKEVVLKLYGSPFLYYFSLEDAFDLGRRLTELLQGEGGENEPN